MSERYLIILLVSFFVTLINTPLMIKLAIRIGFLDSPGKGDPLKIHNNPMPLLGGSAIFLAIILSLFIGANLFKGLQQNLLGIGVAASVLFLIGLYDDYKNLNPYKRLVGQFSAALIIIFFCDLIPNSFISKIIAILYMVALINAMNLLDGIDGLATGITLVAAIGFLLSFLLLNHSLGILISLVLLGASAGFLIYNFNPAKIFLGDNGSTVLGFILGILALLFTSKSVSITHFLVPVLILIVPILDTFLTILRRLKKRVPLFKGDRDHIYDQLIGIGFSPGKTTLLICGLASFGGLAAVFIV